jgi:hypothetical protein
MGDHSTHGANRRQSSRLTLARQYGAYYASVTAAHGYARFDNPVAADKLASRLVDDQCSVHVYDICHDVIAVDWTDAPRYSNGQTIR